MEKKVWSKLEEALDYHGGGTENRWIFSSVKDRKEQIAAIFQDVDLLVLDRSTPVPLVLDYDTPETLGMDRLAAAVGAYHLYPNETILVIDAGSCITYDIVEAGAYKGGVIAPGLKMRMRAMNHFTSRLPDISIEWQDIPLRSPGKSTKECMVNGAYIGMVHEIDGYVEQYMKEYPGLAVILTGGDAIHFESKLKAPIFANLNLVLIGLNRILNHNT